MRGPTLDPVVRRAFSIAKDSSNVGRGQFLPSIEVSFYDVALTGLFPLPSLLQALLLPRRGLQPSLWWKLGVRLEYAELKEALKEEGGTCKEHVFQSASSCSKFYEDRPPCSF